MKLKASVQQELTLDDEFIIEFSRDDDETESLSLNSSKQEIQEYLHCNSERILLYATAILTGRLLGNLSQIKFEEII